MKKIKIELATYIDMTKRLALMSEKIRDCESRIEAANKRNLFLALRLEQEQDRADDLACEIDRLKGLL